MNFVINFFERLHKFWASPAGITADFAIGILCLFTAATLYEYLLGTALIGFAARSLYELKDKAMINLESMTHTEINNLLLLDNLTMELRHDAIRELFRRAQ